MYRFSFVILHYLSYESTAACIDSILSAYVSSDSMVDVIIVDNASTNGSFSRLKEHFKAKEHLHWIRSDENLGFAKGNNLGYRYALNTLKPDFIIIANNDTVFTQTEFLAVLGECYEQTVPTPGLIGPDIRNIAGFHQNPYRDHIITSKELDRWLRNRRLWTMFLYLDKYLHLSEHIGFFRDYYTRRTASGKPDSAWKAEAKNVVLQGACIIFTPVFTEHFKEYAFYPGTFMYCEEDIISCLCNAKGLTTFYTPALYLTHAEAVSTALSTNGSAAEKELFTSKNIVKSLKVLKRIRKHLS